MSRLFAGTMVFCLVSSAHGALAEELPDPTRPPDQLLWTGNAIPGAMPGRREAESTPSGLQSTIISKSRRAAIIDGKTVELGGKHGDDRLVEVNEGSVVLQGAQSRRVLSLFPDVKMKHRETRNGKALSGSAEQAVAAPAAQEEEK